MLTTSLEIERAGPYTVCTSRLAEADIPIDLRLEEMPGSELWTIAMYQRQCKSFSRRDFLRSNQQRSIRRLQKAVEYISQLTDRGL